MFTLIHGRYHGSYRNGRNDKEHANLKGFSGADPPEVPAQIRKTAHSWREAIAECEKMILLNTKAIHDFKRFKKQLSQCEAMSEVDELIDNHKEKAAELKRMIRAFESARNSGTAYPI